MLNCFEILLQHDIIPVVNENDVISVTELMFTDNDELAGLIASMVNADALIILTNVDGLYTGDPSDPASKSNFGRGGMLTKCYMASKIAQLGITVHIGNGTRPNILHDILENKTRHTRFLPFKGVSGRKRWIAHNDNYSKGIVHVNSGAKLALTGSKASSLLPVGITYIKGEFKKKDIIRIVDEDEKTIGLGIAEYGSDKALELIGQKNQKPLVHYDYLYLSQENH
jgi:glutamate 5-kinase